MTEMQVKARANELKEQELATRQRELEETHRANVAKEAENFRSHKASESLTEAADRAKYGYSTYMDPSWSDQDLEKNPQTWYNVIKEGVELFTNPFYSLFGTILKGK